MNIKTAVYFDLESTRDHTSPYRTIQDHTGLYGTIRDHTGPYGTIQDHMGPYRTIQEHTGLQSPHGTTGPYLTILDST